MIKDRENLESTMPMIKCCLCSRRTETSKQRVRIGTDCNWPLMQIHSERHGLDMAAFSKGDFVCIKCHSTISHYRMKDRGPNKVPKTFNPIAHPPGITKNILRGYTETSSPTESNLVLNVVDSESQGSGTMDEVDGEKAQEIDVSEDFAITVTDLPMELSDIAGKFMIVLARHFVAYTIIRSNKQRFLLRQLVH